MNSSDYTIAAIDIAKAKLDIRDKSKYFVVANNETGFAKILETYKDAKNLLLVCEASGGYERHLISYMLKANIAIACINPTRLRAFARSEGVKAKSDSIDTKMILQFAEQKQLRLCQKMETVQLEITALMDRKLQLNKLISSEKNRLDKCESITLDSIHKMIKLIDEQIDEIEKQIEDRIYSHPILRDLFELLTSIKGIGEGTAFSVIAYLDELGKLKRNKIAALVGLAPYMKESGKYKGTRRIEGGRSKVRNMLYMATRSACSHNPVISAYAQRLEMRGKPKKWIKVAAMRKLLMHMHFLTKNYYQSLA